MNKCMYYAQGDKGGSYCTRGLPNDYYDCKGKCEFYTELDPFELNPEYDLYGKSQDKEIEQRESTYINCFGEEVTKEGKAVENMKIKVEGVGKDTEIEVNEKGGKQSKSPMAMHLVAPEFLGTLFTLEKSEIADCISEIGDAMVDTGNQKYFLRRALNCIEPDKFQQLIRIAKVLKEGAKKYEVNNWRLIPQEEHINHALIHLVAAGLGDEQDNHIDHALTRIMMAYATEPSPNFSYTEYIKK